MSGCLLLVAGVTAVNSAASRERPAAAKGTMSYGHLPLAFEPNQGQAAPGVKFLAHGSASTVYLSARELILLLRHTKRRYKRRHAGWRAPSIAGPTASSFAPFRVSLVGASAHSAAQGIGALPGRSNYFLGSDRSQWIRNVPTYSRVRFQAVYPGISAVYYGRGRQLEFDFVVGAGADPGAIRLNFTAPPGRASLRVAANGDLVVGTGTGNVRLRSPRAYQEMGPGAVRRRRFLPARYHLEAGNVVGFSLGAYDATLPLIIDPVLSYSTYLGGADFNDATGIAVDGSGNAYLTGYTTSIDFPVQGGVQSNFSGGNCDTEVNTAPCFDAFVAKLNPQGSGLLYSTYLGGTGDDRGIRIAVDAAGEAYVAGYTNSLDFPIAGAFQNSPGGGTCGTTSYPEPCYDAFIAKLSASGSSLLYASYLGGTGDDFARGLAVDSSGNAYVAGLTSSTNFPTTSGALQTSYSGGPFDSFVTKISSAGTALVYSTYLGGSGEDQAAGITVDSSGNAYLTGQTNSANFPSHGGFQPSYTATSCGSALNSFPCFEAFVSKLNPDGSALVYSSYLGGTAASYGNGIAIDAGLNAYVTGWTTSKDFPVTASAYETAYNGSNEAFVAKVNAAGSALTYATLLGGPNPDVANAIGVDASGNAYVAGYAYGGGFPAVEPLQPASGGFYDAMAAELNATGSALVFSTYLGGTGDDYANDLALDSSGNLYLAGKTFSPDFPTTPSSLTTAYTGGSYDAWAAKIGPQDAAGLTAAPNPLEFPSQTVNSASAPQTVKLSDAGSAPLGIAAIAVTGDFAQTSNCGSTLAPATTCSVNATFTPTATGSRTGAMTITDTAAGSPHTVQLRGYGASGDASLSASSLDFGSVPVGTTSPSQMVTLTNLGQSPLDIAGILAQGDYTQSNDCGSMLNPGASCAITVTFSPSAAGTSVGSVVITDSAANSPQTITLTGAGVSSFSLTAAATSAAVLAGTDQTTFIVSASASPGFTGSINLSCADVAPATCSFNPASIAPGSTSTLTVANLAQVASTSVTFTVTGTESFSSTTTATLPLTVRFADFTLAASPSQVSINAGETATATLTLSPVNGFSLAVTLACTGAPATTSCSLSPLSVKMDGATPQEATLQLTTTSRASIAPPPEAGPSSPPCLEWLAVLVLLLAFFFAHLLRLPAFPPARRAALAALVCILLASCGGGVGNGGVSPLPSSQGTPAGTYTLTVSATAQSLSHSAVVTVRVN